MKNVFFAVICLIMKLQSKARLSKMKNTLQLFKMMKNTSPITEIVKFPIQKLETYFQDKTL